MLFDQLHRYVRRKTHEFKQWIEATPNLIHLSIVILVPLLVGAVTVLSNTVSQLSFLLFPPLASGAYTLFAEPESKYASPKRFVGGLTAGAFCGWLALVVTAQFWHNVPRDAFTVHANTAVFAIFLTVLVTWLFDIEEPAAFSTALLVLVTGADQLTYVVSVAISSALVAGVAVLWRREFYEERARYLYASTKGDDHVLVPIRGDSEAAAATAMFAARLAAAHDAGTVVLLGLVDEGDEQAVRGGVLAQRLEAAADRIRRRVGVPCEVVIATDPGTPARATVQTARETNCDLIVVPYEEEHAALSGYVRSLFRSDADVVAVRMSDERTRWNRVLVPVRKPGDTAHQMIDFAQRLAGSSKTVSVCHCIDHERERRRAEAMLANLVETFSGSFETRVAGMDIERFLVENAAHYDLTIIGASTDRSVASRFISPPTFERIQEIDCDIAIVHRS